MSSFETRDRRGSVGRGTLALAAAILIAGGVVALLADRDDPVPRSVESGGGAATDASRTAPAARSKPAGTDATLSDESAHRTTPVNSAEADDPAARTPNERTLPPAAGTTARTPKSLPTRNHAVSLNGWVIDGDGEPLSGASVRWHAELSAGTSLEEFSTRTLADGSFLLDGVPPTEGRITVTHHAHLPYSRPDSRASSDPIRVELSHGGVVEVLVTDEGSPRPDVLVHAIAGSARRSATSGDDGIARILGLTAGRYRLEVGRVGVAAGEESGESEEPADPGRTPVSVMVDVQLDEPTEIELEISGLSSHTPRGGMRAHGSVPAQSSRKTRSIGERPGAARERNHV